MTGRTHDLAAFTALNLAFIFTPLYPMSLATLLCAILANYAGGLAPDLDNKSAKLWDSVRFGEVISHFLSPLMGGHRLISHSLIGLGLSTYLVNLLLGLFSESVVVDPYVVTASYVIGYGSHLLTDSMTKQGVPLFFPFPIRIGIPPMKSLRINTGQFVEEYLVFPALVAVNIYYFVSNYSKYSEFISNFLYT